MRLAVLLLSAGALLAQPGGGVRLHAHSVSNALPAAHRPYLHRKAGKGVLEPYLPFGGDYSNDALSALDYFPLDEGAVPLPVKTAQSLSPRPAHLVIQNYNWHSQNVAGAADQPSFTIVLKDGSTRSALATWVQGRTLHYTDSDDRNGVLTSAQIDRDATRRMNIGKQRNLQFPPD